MAINKLHTLDKYYGCARNGMAFSEEENETVYLNAHLFYKGWSVIVDYERVLHFYEKGSYDPSREVPVEFYSRELGYCIWEFVKLDDAFGKVDMAELVKTIEKVIEYCKED